jgi:hypothetical protein
MLFSGIKAVAALNTRLLDLMVSYQLWLLSRVQSFWLIRATCSGLKQEMQLAQVLSQRQSASTQLPYPEHQALHLECQQLPRLKSSLAGLKTVQATLVELF